MTPVLALGEVRTAMLQNSVSVSSDVARRLLQLRPGEQVRFSERPISNAVSPDVLTGVDCRLATRTSRKTRGTGTVVTRAVVTGCRVLQGSTYTELAGGGAEPRAPWSHYLSRPGVVEVATGRAGWDDIRDGFLGQELSEALNLGAISDRMIDGIQRRAELDRAPPFRARRTALRWSLDSTLDSTLREPVDHGPRAHFTIVSPVLRTLRLSAAAGIDLLAVVRLCEDLALHDWLLTTLLELIELSQRAADRPVQTVERLRPAVEHLLHLWLPGAHVDESLLRVWEGFERRPGFTRQWDVSVHWIRDQIAVTTASLLGGAPVGR
jgi:hypothetical protein